MVNLVTRGSRVIVIVIALLLAGLNVTGSVAQTPASASPAAGGTGLEGAVSWLVSQQNDDGSFPGFSGEPDAGTTLDVLVALDAAGHAGITNDDVIAKGLAYLESGDVALVYAQTGVGQAAKFALGLSQLGVDPNGFAHVDPMSIVAYGLNDQTGLYGAGVYDHALSLLALMATGQPVPQEAISALEAVQAANGGWAFDGTTDDANVDSNTTSMVVQALVASGYGDDPMVAKGMEFLSSVWTEAGATYGPGEGLEADANSTALVIQARIATGADVSASIPGLLAFQVEGGALCYQVSDPTPNMLATVQAIPALAGVALPFEAPVTSATPIAWSDALAA